MESLLITEIGEVLSQGITRPIFCRAEDGHAYVVKGAYAGARALICKWVAGHLGQELDLPIPPMRILQVDPLIGKFAKTETLLLLGNGLLFGFDEIQKSVPESWLEESEFNFVTLKKILMK